MHVTTAISAVITLLGALVVLIWMPGRPAVQPEPPRSKPPADEPAELAAGLPDAAEVPAGVARPRSGDGKLRSMAAAKANSRG